jgi:UDP-N-acetylmuramoyl-L-alanyl-D-glutamate--2,6-diaminopimelate ligase
MKLSDILKGIKTAQIVGNTDIEITGLRNDSRKIVQGNLFFAIRGIQSDGHNFIGKAIENGACAVVCEGLPDNLPENITIVRVQDSIVAEGEICSNYYGNPTQKIKLIGVTGTNGKTTIATVLYKLIKRFDINAGLISTVTYLVNDKEYESTHTTPDALRLFELYNEMVLEGCEYCFMEVSSHAIHQKRIAGMHFVGGIFTNLTHDHLDYHKTFDEYLKAKKTFFDNLPDSAFALTNIDDKNGQVMVQNTKASVHHYSLQSAAEFKARIIESHFDGTNVEMNGAAMWTPFIGYFNMYNLLAIFGTATLLGFEKNRILKELSALTPVRGRFEYVKFPNGITAIVDYAHTPDALKNVLETICELIKGNEKIITVVGAGGNRDKLKRPVMARVCLEYSNKVILTSDNPRFEEPEDILKDMIEGIKDADKSKYLVIPDRKEAIKTAVMLVAGKGHETYQEIKGIRYHFDDKEVLEELIQQ